MFLPISSKELKDNSIDFVLIASDAYVDHPTYGHALIGRLIEAEGFSVGMVRASGPLASTTTQRLR